MNPRGHMQPYLSNSLAIRQEIQRFESVHPSIYAIYDLIEAIPDPLIQQQIREHVVCIEGKIGIPFINTVYKDNLILLIKFITLFKLGDDPFYSKQTRCMSNN